jgi:hypothetical protein
MFARRDRDRSSRPGHVCRRRRALTLIGLCAAATIDPDQMVRLVESGTARTRAIPKSGYRFSEKIKHRQKVGAG